MDAAFPPACASCATPGTLASFSRCGKCHSTLYCSTACQRKHWSEHKVRCKKAPAPSAPASKLASKTNFAPLEFRVAAAEMISSGVAVLAPLLPTDAVMDFTLETNKVRVSVRSGRRSPQTAGSILISRSVEGKPQLSEVKPQSNLSKEEIDIRREKLRMKGFTAEAFLERRLYLQYEFDARTGAGKEEVINAPVP